jgi:hypothetical protein
MALYAIVGDGELNRKELAALLQDLEQRASFQLDQIWYLMVGKEEPTPTDKAIVKWFVDHETYFEVITSGDHDEHVYDSASDFIEADEITPEFLEETLKAKREGDEDVAVIAMFVNPTESVDEDAELAALLWPLIENRVVVFDQTLQEVTIPDEESEEPPLPAEDDEDEESDDEAHGAWTREDLLEMSLSEVRGIAKGMGVMGKGKEGAINAILGAQGEDEEEALEEAVLETAVSANGSTVLVLLKPGAMVMRTLSVTEAKAVEAIIR